MKQGGRRKQIGSDSEEINMLDRYCRAETLEHLSFTPATELNARVMPNWIGETSCFWYERRWKGGTAYRIVDPEKGTNKPAFDHEMLAMLLSQKTDAEVLGSELPISALEIQDTRIIFNAFGESWCFDGGSVCAYDRSAHLRSWLVSPDGRKAAFVKGCNLWVLDLKTGEERMLTTDGEHHFSYAVETEGRDLVAERRVEESPPEAMWSPDGTKLFTVQLDERDVGTLPSVLFVPQDGTLRPRVIETKYALPGDGIIPRYRFLIVDVETGQNTAIDYPEVEDSFVWLGVFSGNRAWWSGDGSRVYFLDMARGQKSVRVVEAEVDSGKTRVLFAEHSQTYLEIGHDFEAPTLLIPMPESDELIWFSQRTGHAHLYLYDLKSGNLKNAITSGNWSVRNVCCFDVIRREILVQIMGRVDGRDYYYREIAWFNIDSGVMKILASSNHDYDMSYGIGGAGGVSPNGEFVVSNHSRINTASVSDLRNRSGDLLLTLEESQTSELPEFWSWPEPVVTLAADGVTPIYGAVFRPSYLDPDKLYPVLDFCQSQPFYAGVPKQSFSGVYEVAASLAELGIVVVMLDGRGTSFRDKACRDFGYGNFLESGGIADRVEGIKQLSDRYPYMDLDRMGIMDFDASNAGISGLLAFPEFYHVGIASSLYDPRLVKQGEVYMGLTSEEKRESVVIWEDAVHNLKGKLLLVTGLWDKYFHPSSTFHLTDALIKADKDFLHYVQPNGAHGWRVVNARRRMWDFLVENLIGTDPPPAFRLTSGAERHWPEQLSEIIAKSSEC